LAVTTAETVLCAAAGVVVCSKVFSTKCWDVFCCYVSVLKWKTFVKLSWKWNS